MHEEKGREHVLHLAIRYENLTTLRNLVQERKVNVKARDDDGCTALHYAAFGDIMKHGIKRIDLL